MPIKPENAKRYPADWKTIRAEVLERAGHKCENCGVDNYAIGYRDESGTFVVSPFGVLKIVLTIAHKDHIPENVGEPGNRSNLAAWCQKCHLAYDLEHHQRNAMLTRRANKRTVELFDEASNEG